MTDSNQGKRLAKNTLLLYVRMFFLMAVGLYTSRLNLRVLGVTDFGLYGVIGGVVVMFSVVSRSLSSAISRFITYELGKGNIRKLKAVFSTSVSIQLILSSIILLLAETAGLWFLAEKMVIPSERMAAAFWVYQSSILIFIFKVIGIPYNAAIIGHERMTAFAYIGIAEALGQLAVAWGTAYAAADKLIVFAAMHAAIAIIVQLLYWSYCRRNFEECEYRFLFDRPLFRQMLGYAGWNFIGSTSALLRDTGGNIIINLFCGPAVNAARGIAMQVNSAVQSFSTNFMTALNPQITKSYARNEMEYMMTLIYRGARLSFYMLLLLSLPIIVNSQYILALWLGDPPPHTDMFVQLTLVFIMIESLSTPLITANNATGRIRNYQLVVGGIQLLNLPISYALLRLGAAPESVLVTAIVVGICCLFARVVMLRNPIDLNVSDFLRKVLLNVVCVSCLSFAIPYCLSIVIEDSMWKFIGLCVFTIVETALIIYYVGCDQKERMFILVQWQKLQKRIHL